ncbi:MAG: TrmO family methyltransferase [Desulfovibrionaceae bacterium]|nr:SAM-dependent methyltransferase [Desulfovibrionaceae bacterium]MDD4952546.1 TrmO family methyltransferase [Desulfovibrionaceae bacterium]
MSAGQRCDWCGRDIEPGADRCLVDDELVCVSCMYAGAEPFHVYPIGVVRNTLGRGEGFGLSGEAEGLSRIELLPSQERFLYKLEDEARITVIYYLHRARPVRSVFNRGLDGKRVGVFASRTPDRLSGLAVKDAELVRVQGLVLYVRGLDAIDGSPVLDIKLQLGAPQG